MRPLCILFGCACTLLSTNRQRNPQRTKVSVIAKIGLLQSWFPTTSEHKYIESPAFESNSPTGIRLCNSCSLCLRLWHSIDSHIFDSVVELTAWRADNGAQQSMKKDIRPIFDEIDDIRPYVKSIVDFVNMMPAIIAIGDQASGKSSLRKPVRSTTPVGQVYARPHRWSSNCAMGGHSMATWSTKIIRRKRRLSEAKLRRKMWESKSAIRREALPAAEKTSATLR